MGFPFCYYAAFSFSGAPGSKGDTGPTGQRGSDGRPGPRGPAGPPGNLGATGTYCLKLELPLLDLRHFLCRGYWISWPYWF